MKHSTVLMASAIAILGLGLTAQAQVAETAREVKYTEEGDKFTGAYAGIQAGWNHTKVSTPHLPTETANSVCGNVMFGYGQVHSGNVYTGIEAFVGTDNQDKVILKDANRQVKYKSGLNGGLNVRVGAVVSPLTIVYAQFGATQVKDEYIVTQTSGGGQTFSHNKVAFVPGLGAEFLIPESNLSARIDGTIQLPVKTDVGGHTAKTLKPSVKLGLAYRF